MEIAMAFESPNYTQTPNDLFEWLPQMGEAELRVTLCAIRHTFGYHRDSFRLSLTNMMLETGLSRQGVLNGAESAEKRGTLNRTQDGGVTTWVVNVIDYQLVNAVDQLVNAVDQIGLPSRLPSIKEKRKKDTKETISRKRDERTSSKEIQTYLQITGRYPQKVLYDDIIAIMNGKSFDDANRFFKEWCNRGYNPMAATWCTEWLKSGAIPDRNGNGAHKPVEQQKPRKVYQ
jgi:hypothetical protein